MTVEEDSPAGAPAWAVTFGDMMALLLTFFILLVSMSELKHNDKYQGVADSLEEHFGGDSAKSEIHGESKPRDGVLAALATTGRAKRKSLLDRGAGVQSRFVRSGDRTTIGAVIFFADTGAELTDENRRELLAIKERLAGKPQKIEIRGHASRSVVGDPWDLAYQRSRATMQFLIDELQVEPERLRLAVDSEATQEPSRVEVFLLEETVEDGGNTESVLQAPRT